MKFRAVPEAEMITIGHTYSQVATHRSYGKPASDRGHNQNDTHTDPASIRQLILGIKEVYKVRQDMVRAEVSLTLQISAQRCRIMCGTLKKGDVHSCGRKGRYGVRPTHDGQLSDDAQLNTVVINTVAPAVHTNGHTQTDTHTDRANSITAEAASFPLEQMRLTAAKQRRFYEKQLEEMVQQLPVWPWVKSVRGFGAIGLAQIVGECGDLSNYSNPAKLWKRMGLGLIDGEHRQRRVLGPDALLHGFSPQRRAVAWNIGKALMKSNAGGYYYSVYSEYKQRQLDLYPEVIINDKETGKPKNTAKLRAANRAERYMTKRLLKHLWQMWNKGGIEDENPAAYAK